MTEPASDEGLEILDPTAPGHKGWWVIDKEDAARIDCECGWFEIALGFDAGAIAQMAYHDHIEEEA